jgi:LPS export ABC transporter protein LptC
VDSKVSLSAYSELVATDTPDTRSAQLRAHLDSVRVHIKGLGEKRYETLYGISSPDDKKIVVRNNVEILNVKGERLNTEELHWQQDSGKIYTDRFVRITTKDQIITGTGLVSDQAFSDWEILNVSGTLNVPHDQIPHPRSVVPGRGRY